MLKFSVRRAALIAALVPFALAVSACKDGSGTGAAAAGAAIAKIAPPAGKAWNEVLAATDDGGMRMGNPEAPLKLVEYGSLSCPGCAKLAQDSFAELTGDMVNSGRVSFEFRSFAIHPQDVPLTMLVKCAPPEAFFPLVEQIYRNFTAMNAPYSDKARLDQAQAAMSLPADKRWPAFADALGYTEFFSQRGIAVEQAHACLADPKAAEAVAAQAQKIGDSGIGGTPTLELNGKKLDMNSWDLLKPELQRAGAR